MNDTLLNNLLAKAKVTLRVTTTAFDNEIKDIISAGYEDLETRGVQIVVSENAVSPMVLRALMTYTRMYFGDPDNWDRLRVAYDRQLGQLMTTSGYTNWGDSDGQE